MFKKYQLKNIYYLLILYVSLLTMLGIVLIGSAEKSLQRKQLYGFAAGLFLMCVISFIDYHWLLKLYWLYYIGTCGLLALVLVAGDSSGGAQRWFEIGFRFQPSEVAKIGLILFFARFFEKREGKINQLRTILFACILAAGPLFLILKQPDLSTTIVTTFIFIILLFIAGLSYKIVIGALALSIPTVIIGLSIIITKGSEFLQPYQRNRIMSWIDPTNPMYSDIARQQQNSIMAIGSGQFWGKGLNNTSATSMKNTNFIIEPDTDFIFAVSGEELGFLGSTAIIILLLLIVLECILVARKASTRGGMLICCGVAAWIGFQSFVNICVATGLFPNTGVTLPFVSYGLTSLMSLFIGIGFVINVGLQPTNMH